MEADMAVGMAMADIGVRTGYCCTVAVTTEAGMFSSWKDGVGSVVGSGKEV